MTTSSNIDDDPIPSELTPICEDSQLPARRLRDADLPKVIKTAGPSAAFAYEEFLFGQIRNKHTRRAYTHAVHQFLDWSLKHDIQLQQVRPRDKGGKHRKVPVRHDLQQVLLGYLNAAGIRLDEKDAPIFRTAVPKKRKVTRNIVERIPT
jgi:hypothetical protein